ncbi:chromate efflux transporter [Reinekea thalattae]|uniref:Chromate efflux transporter n=1 Tax=Reinekea thalattae TaxID=2593301 RepID=A0A5C8ZAC3_9GAMM|nr:chromate efflux transporter [Reinekea thalattae]TXR54374.1 chromate efflux transporter [Reinekea thalattae]
MPAQTKSSLRVFFTFLKLGLTSFGGPIAHIGYFHKELIEKQKWLSDAQFAQLFSICQFLPGPASSQLGFILGYQRAGLRGALAAFIAFTLPSALALIFLAQYLPYLSTAAGQLVIQGLKLVAVIVVADAILSMGKKLCPDWPRRILAILACLVLVIFSSALSQLAVILVAALAGMWLCRPEAKQAPSELGIAIPATVSYVSAISFVSLLIIALLPPMQSTLLASLQSFYYAGALVFGGGHVVLPLLEQAFVAPGLISQQEFLVGYGAAQTVPGPLFSIAGYIGALIPSDSPLLFAALALCLMFLPGFLLVLAVLPLWPRLQTAKRTQRAIAGVNAAVVGILLAAFLGPMTQLIAHSPSDIIISLIGFGLLNRFKISVLWIACWCIFSQVVKLGLMPM